MGAASELTMNDDQAAYLVFSYLASKGEALSNDYLPRIVERIPDALQALSETVATSPSQEFRDLLRKEFTAQSTADDTFDLESLRNPEDNEPLLFNHLDSAVVTHADVTYPLQPLPSASLALLKSSPLFAYRWLEGDALKTKNVAADPYVPLTDSLSVVGNFRPEIERIEGQLQPPFIEILAGMIRREA